MFNEFLLYISDPVSMGLILSFYTCLSLGLIYGEHAIKLNTVTEALRLFGLVIVGYIATNLMYFSIRFLITRQIFSNTVYLFILYICCVIPLLLVYTVYLLSTQKEKKEAKTTANVATMLKNNFINEFLDSDFI